MKQLQVWLDRERGLQVKLALFLGVKPPVVAGWLSGKRPIPMAHGAAIEAFTERHVTRQQMFPNDWRRVWPELAVETTQPQSPVTQED